MKHAPLTPAVLQILMALADGERHGYAIAQEIERSSRDHLRMGPGTLYGSLQRMLDDRLIEPAPAPDRRDPDNARRRYYRLTPSGRRSLHAELDRLAAIVAFAKRKRLLRSPEPA